MLHVATKHISLNTVRNRKSNVDIDSHPSSKELSTFSSEEIYTKKETFSIVERIINQELTPLQQKIIQLREYEGKSFEEIACDLGMQPAAVRMQLSRARKTIRECYRKYSYE
jgi:RNA polymerase sigma-70 factor (ECF subfamily)